MAFSRKQMAAAVAGTLSLAMLTGCPAAAPTGTTPGASATPAPGTSAAPTTGTSTAPTTSAAPTTGTSAAPSTDASGNPTSPMPTSSGPAPSGKSVILSGNVYDEEGATVDGALVTVKSLDASVPYSATATSQAGSWVVNNVPEGANVEIVATKDGWTTRRRVGSFQQQATGKRNVINFGAAGGEAEEGDDDVTGEAYFISDYPEIVATTPADESTDFDSTKVSFKLTFSEPLTEDSRENFEDVFTVLPASEEAIEDGSDFVDLETEGEDDSDEIDDLDITFAIGSFEYNLQEGDAFLGSSRTKMTASWNSEGTEVTFSFGGALLADDNETAKYQMALVVEDAADEIEDEDGNQLGTPASGRLDGAYVANGLIHNAFKEEDLSIDSTNTTGDDNWSFTHDTVSNFEVREDDTTPKLTSVDVTEEGESSRIELVFSEPMAAFGTGGDGIYGEGLFEIENYTFAVGEDNGDLDDVELEGNEEADVTAGLDIGAETAIENIGGTDSNFEEEFFFNDASNAVEVDQDESIDALEGTATEIFMELDEDNPNTLFIWFVDLPNFFDGVNEIKARVEGVQDPAGNEIEEADADANVVEAGI